MVIACLDPWGGLLSDLHHVRAALDRPAGVLETWKGHVARKSTSPRSVAASLWQCTKCKAGRRRLWDPAAHGSCIGVAAGTGTAVRPAVGLIACIGWVKA